MIEQNADCLDRELNWMIRVIDTRLNLYFEQPTEYSSVYQIEPPVIQQSKGTYAAFISQNNLNYVERFVLILAMAVHIKPRLLDVFLSRNKDYDKGFTEFGGKVKADTFIPTGETLVFILGAEDLVIRFRIKDLFENNHVFARKGVLKLERSDDYSDVLKGELILNTDFLDHFTKGKAGSPVFSASFPARLVTSDLEWNDLVIDKNILSEVELIVSWIEHNEYLFSKVSQFKHLKMGYRSLFYGPPGTGKTLTAGLIGKRTGRDVYHVDLSMVVSKWVGETEKNLSKIFEFAERKDWILFFDEADALFGKRSDGNSSNDRYSNQEISYLLQRTENYNGVIILASNMKGNMDEAFTRRFQSVVYFPMPTSQERFQLWMNYFGHLKTDAKINYRKIADSYELTGGNIVNILKYCALQSLGNNDCITEQFILEGIKRELLKDGKTLKYNQRRSE